MVYSQEPDTAGASKRKRCARQVSWSMQFCSVLNGPLDTPTSLSRACWRPSCQQAGPKQVASAQSGYLLSVMINIRCRRRRRYNIGIIIIRLSASCSSYLLAATTAAAIIMSIVAAATDGFGLTALVLRNSGKHLEQINWPP